MFSEKCAKKYHVKKGDAVEVISGEWKKETGKIVACAKIRGFNKSMDTLANMYDELVLDKSAPVGIAHADNPEGAQRLEDRLREKGFTGELLKVVYEPVTGSHVGPGTVAVFYMGEHK